MLQSDNLPTPNPSLAFVVLTLESLAIFLNDFHSLQLAAILALLCTIRPQSESFRSSAYASVPATAQIELGFNTIQLVLSIGVTEHVGAQGSEARNGRLPGPRYVVATIDPKGVVGSPTPAFRESTYKLGTKDGAFIRLHLCQDLCTDVSPLPRRRQALTR